MKIIINNIGQKTVEGSTVKIASSASDPVSTCSLTLVDNNSSLNVLGMQELLVLDDQKIPYPTANLCLNPTMNPYTTYWSTSSGAGQTVTQNGGGGIAVAFANAATSVFFQSAIWTNVVADQTYTASVTITGSSPVNIQAQIAIFWYDAAFNYISQIDSAPITATSGSQLISVSGIAPIGITVAACYLVANSTNATNSGSVAFTNAQMEAHWFPTISYPTPFCGPNQANCTPVSFGFWIRQYRKFAGFITHATYTNYHGNVREVQVDAVSYGWLMSTVISNKTYTSQYDSAIIADLLTTYFTSTSIIGTGLYGNKLIFTTANVIQGVMLSSLQIPWDDLRTVFNNLAAQASFYWTVDYYWNFVYIPLAYLTMPISLICDNSAIPNNVTTFPAYNFSAEMDYTQPGCNIFVFGNSTNTAQVRDPAQIASLVLSDWFALPSATSWTRKVNDTSLNSSNDVIQRGLAELLQYDFPRNIYHLTTNVELIAGQAISVTSNTDGLNATSLLIQSVTAAWIGTSDPLADVWEYQADLGATNRPATSILSRLFRLATANSAPTTVSTFVLAVIERLGMTDTPAIASHHLYHPIFSPGRSIPLTSTSPYQALITGNSPIAYYRMGELEGAKADDFSGNNYVGTIVGGVTLGATGPHPHDANKAMTFNGSTGEITATITTLPTGSAAWSLEAWANLSSISGSHINTIVSIGTWNVNNESAFICVDAAGKAQIGTFGGNHSSTTSIATGGWHHFVGAYDGANMYLYVDGVLVLGPVAQTMALTGTGCAVASRPGTIGNQLTGSIDEMAIYNYTLTANQVANHYAIGTA